MNLQDVALWGYRCCRASAQILTDLKVHWHITKKRQSELPRLPCRVWQQGRLLLSNSITAQEYYAYGLYRRKVPHRVKQEFLGNFDGYRFFLRVNDREYSGLVEDKLVFQQYMHESQIPMPQLCAVLGGDTVMASLPCPHLRTRQQVRDWFVASGIEHVVLKPCRELKGIGIVSLGDRLDALTWQSLPTKSEIDLEWILGYFDRYRRQRVLVQERLEPHPCLAALAPNVLHTARVVTLSMNDVEIVAAALRVGRGHVPADNLAQGGIVVPIDIETGNCGAGTMLVDQLPRQVELHPLTDARISGLQIADWDEVLRLVTRAARKLWFATTVGWDIALTSRGPMVLEANLWHDPGVIQMAWGQGILTTPLAGVFAKSGIYRQIGLGLLRPPPPRADNPCLRLPGEGRPAAAATPLVPSP